MTAKLFFLIGKHYLISQGVKHPNFLPKASKLNFHLQYVRYMRIRSHFLFFVESDFLSLVSANIRAVSVNPSLIGGVLNLHTPTRSVSVGRRRPVVKKMHPH